MIFNFLREFSLMKFMIENFEIYFDTLLNRFQRETIKKDSNNFGLSKSSL